MPEPALPPPPNETVVPAYELASARSLRRLLLFLVCVLTFEGLVRKLQIPGANIPIFLFKDVLVLIMGFHVLRISRPPPLDFLAGAYTAVCILFLPVIIVTAIHDPVLAIYGAKQYLLYPIVGLSFFLAYHDQSIDQVIRFFRWTTLLIIPTTVVAMMQIRLPAGHWLNLSVDGDNMNAFSAGGQLRVSSTFPFVSQYGGFLSAELFMLVIAFTRLDKLNFIWKAVYFSLIPLLVIGDYITGSRGAVLGGMSMLALVVITVLMKFQTRNFLRIIVAVALLAALVLVAQYYLPQEFAAYSEREQGHLIGVSQEIQNRIFISLFAWVDNIFTTPFFGSGLGIMSNGTQFFSDYAAHIREMTWTETDYAATLYEGGFYLVLVWYGFRYYVLYQTWRRVVSDVNEELTLPAAFAQALVILFGFNATIGMQPPTAIWWWLAVGTTTTLWWKSIEPKRDSGGLVIPTPPPTEKKLRGRSAYADRLHGGR